MSSFFFRFTRNGGFCDVVRVGQGAKAYWHKTQIYPIRLMEVYGPDPLPLPSPLGCLGWVDSKALRKSLADQGWKLVNKSTDNRHIETGCRTTKKKVRNG